MVLIVQHAEGLTDRQVVEAVRSRIDLKYALGLELTDCGFDYSVLSEYRDRLIAGGVESKLLDDMLEKFQERGWLAARGRQRTDSTHVLAATRKLNRLETVGETMRCALNDLATVAPDWLRERVTPDWFDLYGPRFEQYRLPKKKTEQEELAQRVGADGYQLLSAIYAADAPTWLREVPAVQTLRQVWVQQYYQEKDCVCWRMRGTEGLPPNKLLIQSPYDPEARNRTKRSLNWTGYAAHITETCDPDAPNVIVNIETTPATTGDVDMTAPIHTSLKEKGLLPKEHFVDSGYVDAENLVNSRSEHGIDLHGPAPPDCSWQARVGQGFDTSHFVVDWTAHRVTCPQGRVSRSWHSSTDEAGREKIQVGFAAEDCASCPCRDQCTKARNHVRTLHLKAKAQHEMLQAARQRQTTEEFRQRHKVRAGIEGTISQGTRSFDLRRSRYIGLPKTHLQHVLVAAAINLARVMAWLDEIPRAQTRQSRFAALGCS
jgi:transposase